MALSAIAFILIAITLFVMTFVTYLFTRQLRIFRELIITFDFAILSTIFLLAFSEFDETLLGIVIAAIVAISIFIMFWRFNHHIKNPYSTMVATNERILKAKNFSMKSKSYLSDSVDLISIKRSQDEIVDNINTLLREIRDDDNEISVLLDNIDTQSSQMSDEVNEITNDVDQILQSAAVISENIADLRSMTVNVIDRIESDFNQLSELAKSSDRISDQTNLIAVNAAIEAANTEGQTNFETVAESIQQLSSRSKGNSDSLHRNISSLRRDTTNNLNRLVENLDRLEDDIISLGELSNRSSSYTHQQTIFVQEIRDLVKNAKTLSSDINGRMSEYKLDQ